MKPRYRPGKAGTAGRAARKAIAKAKPLSANQMAHIREEKPENRMAPKAGRQGERANWDIDYAEGVECDAEQMPCREPESFTVDGVRRWPKRGR
jgi:hypothetical protein